MCYNSNNKPNLGYKLRMIIKTGCFSDLKILEILQIITESRQQDPNTIINIPNIEKQEQSNWNEPQIVV